MLQSLTCRSFNCCSVSLFGLSAEFLGLSGDPGPEHLSTWMSSSRNDFWTRLTFTAYLGMLCCAITDN